MEDKKVTFYDLNQEVPTKGSEEIEKVEKAEANPDPEKVTKKKKKDKKGKKDDKERKKDIDRWMSKIRENQKEIERLEKKNNKLLEKIKNR